MSLLGLPLVGHLYLSPFITLLILTLVALLIYEKKKSKKALTKEQTAVSLSQAESNSNIIQEKQATEQSDDGVKAGKEEHLSREEPSASVADGGEKTCSSAEGSPESSGSEGVVTRVRRRQARVVRKKHKCTGSVEICSKKKVVREVTIISSSEEEQVQVTLQDLTAKFESGGLTCTVHSSTTHRPLLNTDSSHLNLFFITTSDSCSQLQESVVHESAKSSGEFKYCVLLTDTGAGNVKQAAERLIATLADCGGTEWVPLSHIALLGRLQDPTPLTSQQYTTNILDKITRLSQKCCGTSCSSKKSADIEDLALSLLPAITPVQT